MDERAIRSLIRDVKAGRLTRRRFVQIMVGLGLTAPMAAQMLAASGVAAQPKAAAPAFTPTKRGGGGPLKVLWWQAPDAAESALRHRHQGPGRLAHLLRAARPPSTPTATWCPFSRPRCPAWPTAALSKDGTWVIWNLKKGVQWHDGKPFTADDVVFNWEYAADPATAAVTIGAYARSSSASRSSTTTASRSSSRSRTPFWADAFCGYRGHDHPQAPVRRLQGRQVARGARPTSSRSAPAPTASWTSSRATSCAAS